MPHDRTNHQQRVLEFMLRAKQDCPMTPKIPDEKVRLLRARLILEEALETIDALGVTVRTCEESGDKDLIPISMEFLKFYADKKPDIVGVADGCADVSVVTTGTLIAFGIRDEPLLECVDASNLSKFGPGHSYREDGKLIKPPNFAAPDIQSVLTKQGLIWPPPKCEIFDAQTGERI